jgi:hypothetical protein
MKRPVENTKPINERIAELKSKADRLAGGVITSFESPDAPPEILEQFWKRAVEFEKAPTTTNFAQLTEAGVDLPAPADLSEDEVNEKLQEVIAELARLRVFLVSTDHLSDRELYEKLWEDLLQETIVPDTSPNSSWTIDFVSSGSDEDIELYLKYYADPAARAEWQEMWRDESIPAHEDPPYDRDRHLPKPAWEYQH